MNLKEIFAVTGQSGLFQFVSQGRAGIIVESLLDKRRSTIPPAAKASSLADVVIFTEAEEMPLAKVLQAIKDLQNAAPALDVKKSAEAELKDFFAKVVPTYDRERVHFSDIKKIVAWYNLLQVNNLLDFEVSAQDSPASEAAGVADKSAPKPAVSHVQAAAPRATSKAAGATKIMAPRKAQ
ncbi:hypothetical protein AGMMS4956_09950 [Bacteroidia bacterium]|nr:hypothetical protein AGMMS4956_09950 [Bacteroidia bacterium]